MKLTWKLLAKICIICAIIYSCKLQFINTDNSNQKQDTSFINKERIDSIINHTLRHKKNEYIWNYIKHLRNRENCSRE
jgi:hypothetical protein